MKLKAKKRGTSAGFDSVDLEEKNEDTGQVGHVPS